MYTNLQMKLVRGYPELADVLNCCTLLYGRDAPFPVGISNFILAITRGTPICAILIIPPLDGLQALCKKIVQGHCVKEHPSDMLLLQPKCPLLFGLLAEVNDQTLTSKLHNLLQVLLEIAAAPFQVTSSPVDQIGSEGNAVVDGLTYFPSLPRVRGRGFYCADRPWITSEAVCNKRAGRHPTLLPGIFLVHCVHGTCRITDNCNINSLHINITVH